MRTLQLQVSSETLDDLIRGLESLPEVTVATEHGHSKGSRFERDLSSEPVTLVTVAVILGLKALPRAIDAIRDIIVEHIRSRRVLILFTDQDGGVIGFSGPIDDAKKLEQLSDVINQRFIAEE